MKAITGLIILTMSLLVQGFIIDPCQAWKKDYKLTWADFTGFVPIDHKDAASTKTKLVYNSSIINDTLNLNIETYFIRDKSWVVVTKREDYLLNHEQRHFDIAEINARKFRQYALKWDGKYNITAYLSEGCDFFLKGTDSMQQQYDNETNHSINKPLQAKWDKKIDSLLDVYKAYENPIVKLPRKK